MTKNEILYSLNKPEDYILAMVEFLPGGEHRVRYLRRAVPPGAGFRCDERELRLRRTAGQGGRTGIGDMVELRLLVR